jgi:hypothetical protein
MCVDYVFIGGAVLHYVDCEEAEVLCSFDRRVRGDAKGLDNTSVPYTPMNKQGWNEPSLHTTKLKFVSDLELIPLRCSAGKSCLHLCDVCMRIYV